MEHDIPDNVRTLIASHINSVVQLELLLLLHAQPARARTARDISNELRVDPGWVTTQLRDLCSSGLLACQDASSPAFQYAPASPAIADAVSGLAQTYATHRVTVIGLIFSKPVDPIRSFTDAFRLRKDKD